MQIMINISKDVYDWVVCQGMLGYANAFVIAKAIENGIVLSEGQGAINALQMERLSQFYNGEWIPCEDRVPVNDDYVLAWNENPIVAYYDGDWYSNDGNFDEDISPITYWMPLPKKPKEVE